MELPDLLKLSIIRSATASLLAIILLNSTQYVLCSEETCLIILLILSLIVRLEMNVFIVRNSTNGMNTVTRIQTNAIPITKLESNESKYSKNGSDVTSIIDSLTVRYKLTVKLYLATIL